MRDALVRRLSRLGDLAATAHQPAELPHPSSQVVQP
jgi:hypothetical protein